MVFEVNTSTLDSVDGSAELIIGNTKVIASVSGPIEPKARQELPNMASLEIVVRPSVGVSSTREKLIEDKLRSLLQGVILRYKYPRQLIQIVVQFLITDYNSTFGTKNDFTNNELNAAINCCYFALIDAGIGLKHSFASVSLCSIKDEFFFNPTLEQLIKSDSHHVVGFSIENKEPKDLIILESQGEFVESQLFTIIEKSVGECSNIHEKQRDIIADKIHRDYIWKA